MGQKRVLFLQLTVSVESEEKSCKTRTNRVATRSFSFSMSIDSSFGFLVLNKNHDGAKRGKNGTPRFALVPKREKKKEKENKNNTIRKKGP